MAKWFAAIGALIAALGILLWQLAAPAKTKNLAVKPAFDASLAMPVAPTADNKDNKRPALRSQPSEAPSKPEEAESEPKLLVPGTEEFSERLDYGIPYKFRDVVSDCYPDEKEGGLNPDLKLKLGYQLRVVNGEVFATDIKVMTSELPKELEDCMVSAVKESRWQYDDMPDWSEDHELLIRLRGLRKFQSRREFDED